MQPAPTTMASKWSGPRNAAGQYHGRGVLTHPDGGRTEGEWVNGLLQGPGVETHPGGKRVAGHFVGGQMQGPGVITHPDGTRLEGEFVRGNAHGRWLLTRPDGTRFELQYDNGTQLSEKVPRRFQAPALIPSDRRAVRRWSEIRIQAMPG